MHPPSPVQHESHALGQLVFNATNIQFVGIGVTLYVVVILTACQHQQAMVVEEPAATDRQAQQRCGERNHSIY